MSDQNALLTDITAANRRFMDAFKRDDAAAIAAGYTADGHLLVPHMAPICGRAAIEAVFRAMGGHGHTLEPVTAELEGHSDTAIETGRYTRKDAGGATLDTGKYVLIWKRVDGVWQMHRDMVSTDLPRPA